MNLNCEDSCYGTDAGQMGKSVVYVAIGGLFWPALPRVEWYILPLVEGFLRQWMVHCYRTW